MVRKSMYQKIQKLRLKGLSKNQISKNLNLDNKTVSKYYSLNEDEFLSLKSESMDRSKVFDPFRNSILEVYEKNNNQKLNISAVFDYLEEHNGNLPGSEKTLRNYISYLINNNHLKLNKKMRTYTSVPEMPPGKQIQLDFGEYRCSSGLKLYIFATVLSNSRFRYVALQDRPFKTLDTIQHLLDCFDYIGGIPEELVIDQDKVMVVSENKGDIVYTKDFKYFIEEMGLSMYVCRKADPETKGKIENLIKYVKHNFFSPRDFTNLYDAQESLLKWLKRRANGKVCQSTKQIPSVMIEVERLHLRKTKNSIFRKDVMIHRDTRLANEKALISVKACQYQLPLNYKNRDVDIYDTDTKLFVFDCNTGQEIAEHDISLFSGKIVPERKHKRQSEITAQELKDQVQKSFDSSLWLEFTSINFKSLVIRTMPSDSSLSLTSFVCSIDNDLFFS